MDFCEFFEIAKKVFKDLPVSFLQKFSKSKKDVELKTAIRCYNIIFKKQLETYKNIKPVNEYLFDFETVADPLSDKNIVIRDNDEHYVFSIKEILKWISDQLGNSNIVFEPVFKITSLVKNFRLPRNPYTNKVFSHDQIRQMLSQIVYKKQSCQINSSPELKVFFHHYRDLDFSLDGYQSTTDIIDVFEKHGLQFKEKFNKKNNRSAWIMK